MSTDELGAQLMRAATRPVEPYTVPVAEAFGPVWQGEGPAIGRRCSFLRLGLCNLACEWCDTPYTWDRSRFDLDRECPPREAGWIVDQVRGHGTDLLVLTGGEPLMHRGNDALREALGQLPHVVHVETNGTLLPTGWLTDRVEQWIVSPKVAQSTDRWTKRVRPDLLHWFARIGADFKFVARSNQDVQQIAQVVAECGIDPAAVWVMPEGRDPEDLIARHRDLAPAIEAAGYHTTTRLHVLLYGDERGR